MSLFKERIPYKPFEYPIYYTEGWLKQAGASEIRRLERGTDFDRVEQVYQHRPFAEVKYGVGEQRYFFRK